jgi:hypothetical protein
MKNKYYVMGICILSILLLSGCITSSYTQQESPWLVPNAYGPGVHMNQYGEPVNLIPAWGGVPGETLQIKPNAYGPGVHMDQYGRPVYEVPAFCR